MYNAKLSLSQADWNRYYIDQCNAACYNERQLDMRAEDCRFSFLYKFWFDLYRADYALPIPVCSHRMFDGGDSFQLWSKYLPKIWLYFCGVV